jgi:hypothetical protein
MQSVAIQEEQRVKFKQPFHLFALFTGSMIAYGAGCSSSTTTSPSTLGGGNDSGGDGATGSASDDGGTSATSTTTGGGTADQMCAMSSSGMACVMCCQSGHPMGIKNLVMYVQGCVCGNNGVCAMDCANEYCMNGSGMPGDACDTCIQSSVATADGGMGACYNAVSGGCMGDTECTAYVGCIGGCPAQ